MSIAQSVMVRLWDPLNILNQLRLIDDYNFNNLLNRDLSLAFHLHMQETASLCLDFEWVKSINNLKLDRELNLETAAIGAWISLN